MSPSTNGAPNRPIGAEDEQDYGHDRIASPTTRLEQQQQHRHQQEQQQQQHRRKDSHQSNSEYDDPHSRAAGSPISSISSLRQTPNRMGSLSQAGESPRHRRLNSETISESGPDNLLAANSATAAAAATASLELLRTKEEEIGSLRARQEWMKVTLALATSRGFVAPPPIVDGDSDVANEGLEGLKAGVVDGSDHEKILEALIQMKQELARSKVSHFIDHDHSSELCILAR